MCVKCILLYVYIIMCAKCILLYVYINMTYSFTYIFECKMFFKIELNCVSNQLHNTCLQTYCTHTHTYIYVYIYICVCVCVFVCLCVYIYIYPYLKTALPHRY